MPTSLLKRAFLFGDCRNVQPSAELLKINVEVDIQPIISIHLHTMEVAQAAYDEGQAMLDALNAQYDDIISWADMYDSTSMESKKMIVSCLIRRVEVYRDYRLHIDFNIDFEQFSAGLDISAIAA